MWLFVLHLLAAPLTSNRAHLDAESFQPTPSLQEAISRQRQTYLTADQGAAVQEIRKELAEESLASTPTAPSATEGNSSPPSTTAEKAAAEAADAEKAAEKAAAKAAAKEAAMAAKKAAAEKAAAEKAAAEKAVAEKAAAEKAAAEKVAAEKAAAKEAAAPTDLNTPTSVDAPSTATPKAEGCSDTKDMPCAAWAQEGECHRNPMFMHPTCALSCGCPAPAHAPSSPVPMVAERPGPVVTERPAPVVTERPAPKGWAEKKPSLEATGARAQVLVIVSDHGSGTSNFANALNTHPCVQDIGEPFGMGQMLWAASDEAAACSGKRTPDSIFDTDSTGTLKNTNNPKLNTKIEAVLKSLKLGKLQVATGVNVRSLYEGLTYDLADYFVRIHDLICKEVPADVCPPSNCTISLKMFPNYVNGRTPTHHTKDDVAFSSCEEAINVKAMTAWKDALMSFEQNPKITTIAYQRDELHRQFSNFHRFDDAGTEFDCSLPRPLDMFQTFSKDHTDAQLQSEDCWEDSNKCLSEALKLVGLSAEPMGPEATELMAGVDLKESKDNDGGVRAVDKYLDPDSKSCSTNPTATFKRLENFGVQMLAPGGLSKLAAPHQVRGAQGWDATFGWDVPGWDANFVPSTPQVIFEEYEEPESTQTPLDFLDE